MVRSLFQYLYPLVDWSSFQWIVVDSRVFDVSKFANLHPGGAAVLLVDSIGNDPPPTAA